MPDPPAGLRSRWIAWSLRPDVRPSVLAMIVRARGGIPPALPLRAADAPADLRLQPGERRILQAREPSAAEAARAEERATQRGCRIETPCEGGWLAVFWREMTDPPAALYVRGRMHLPGERAVAIVGTRHPSENGLAIARSLARDVAAEGVTIVSGLALGIDAAAHRGALDVGGRTVAVLGGGVDRPSPPSHGELAERVARSGALGSEFPFGCEPRPLHFPRRNRILAALAQVVVVVEGGSRSGARSTVDHALALGREVAAVPRDPVHEGSALPDALLRTGATPVVTAADVLELTHGAAAPPPAPADPLERQVLDCLGTGRRNLASLTSAAGRPADQVLASLGRLELSGRIRRLPGPLFERVGSGT